MTLTCKQNYTEYTNLTKLQATILITLNTLVSFFNAIASIICGAIIIKTKQWKNQSTLLMLLLSIADTFSAVVSETIYTTGFIAYHGKKSCITIVLSVFFILLFKVTSYLITTIINIDRYIHIKYRNHYASVFTKTRFRIAIAVAVLIAVVESLIVVTGIVISGKSGELLVTLLMVFLLLVNVALYIKSIYLLWKFKRSGESLSSGTRNITKIASLCLLVILLSFIPLAVWSTIFHILPVTTWKKGVAPCVGAMCSIISNIYATANAILFLVVNRASRRLIKKMCPCSKNRVGVTNPKSSDLIKTNRL